LGSVSLTKIEFSSGCGDAGFTAQWWDNAATAGSAQVITVGNAMIGGIDATLRGGGAHDEP